MSNLTILERFIIDLDEFQRTRGNKYAFTKKLHDTIEALEGIPYSVITEMGEWQDNIEIEGYFDDEGFESKIEEVIPQVKLWVQKLIKLYTVNPISAADVVPPPLPSTVMRTK